MGFIRNLLAVVGLVVLIGAGIGAAKILPIMSEFDPGWQEAYMSFATTLLETKDPGNAMVWSVPVNNPDITVDELRDSLKNLASSNNFLFVGTAPFYKQVQALTNQPYRHVEFLSFCDAGVGKMMADYNDVYTAFMPCRIAIVEDKKGKLWLHSMNLDLMIHGGKELPADLKKEAIRIRNVLVSMMEGAAAGDF